MWRRHVHPRVMAIALLLYQPTHLYALCAKYVNMLVITRRVEKDIMTLTSHPRLDNPTKHTGMCLKLQHLDTALNASTFDCETNKAPPRYLVLCPRRAENIRYVHHGKHCFHNVKEYWLSGQILNICQPTPKLTGHFFMEITKEEVVSCGSLHHSL